jgi:acyl-CoA reductase-like NAD-dependent aldehyde dehydrogenase
MSLTSRGAVAPTVDRAGQNHGPGATQTAPLLDAAALSEVVALVADHAPGWAKTDATARADLLSRVMEDTMAAQDDWLAAACAAKCLTPGSTEAGE